MLSGDVLLKNISDVLLSRILPEIESQHTKGYMGTILFLINTVCESYDNEAASKITENERLKELFSVSLPVIKDDELRKKMQDALDKKEKSFRLSDINEFNHYLKNILIELHANVELLEGDDAEKIDKMIWQELSDDTVEKSNSVIKLYMVHNEAIRK